jgi:hypothetical protein
MSKIIVAGLTGLLLTASPPSGGFDRGEQQANANSPLRR